MNLQPRFSRSHVVGGEIRRVPMEIEPARCNGVLHTDVVLRSFSASLKKKITWEETWENWEREINVAEKKSSCCWCRPVDPTANTHTQHTAGYRSGVHAGMRSIQLWNVRDFELAFASSFSYSFFVFCILSASAFYIPANSSTFLSF